MKNSSKIISFCLIVLCTLVSESVFGQGQANTWYFGTKIGIDFNTNTQLTNGNHDTGLENGEGVSSVSDTNGVYLFMSDGTDVRDLTGTYTNGTGLLGSKSATQSAIIVPVPGSKTKYHLFTVPCEEASGAYTTGGSKDPADGVRYNIVDPGTRTVTNKNTQFSPASVPVTEGLTAVPDFAGTGYWVIFHQAGDKTAPATSVNTWFAYHVHPGNTNATTGVITLTAADRHSYNLGTGINGALASGPNPASSNGQVLIKANSCFNRVAMVHSFKSKLVEVFTFDNSTGVMTGVTYSITNFQAGDVNELYGLEFSPDGKSIFVGVLGQNFGAATSGRAMYQFNVTSESTGTINTAANTSRRTTTVAANGLGQFQLGPDGNIYYSHHFNNPIGSGSSNAYVGRITSPNSFPATYNDSYYNYTVSGGASKMGLTQVYKGFIAGVASVKPGVGLAGLDEVCVGEAADFDATYTQSGTNWKWNIDANIGPNTTIEYTTQNITHTYGTAGTYDVVLTLQDAICLYTVTEKTQIKVNPVVNTAGTISCGAGTLTGNVTSPNAAYKYVWYSDAALTKPVAVGSSAVSLPYLGTDNGNFYLRAESTSTTSSTSAPVDYFPTGIITSYGSQASGNTMTFTVNSAINLTSFTWGLGTFVYSGCPVSQSYTVKLTDNAGTGVFYTVNRTLDPCAGSTRTENVNLKLGPGTYKINIVGPAGRAPENNSTGYTYPYSLNAAVNFPSGNPNFLQDFIFTIPTVTVTSFPCSKPATISYNCPLPVTWLGFTANRSEAASVLLNWATASEENSKVYDIQRSLDGVNFESIGQVAAAGNSHSVRTYSYTDYNAPVGNVYYRLLQEDMDGASAYSKIVYVNGSGNLSLSLVPNPGNGSFTIIGLSGDTKLDVAVYSITGQSLYTTAAYPGQVVDLGDLAKGFYVVRITSGSSEQSIRYINQ